MHEGHFTEKIVDVILHELKNHTEGKVKSVKVKVGETFHLVPESVQMHFDIIVKGTVLEDVKLDLQEEPLGVFCQICQKEGTAEDHHMILCPYCHSPNVKSISGNTITVESIEIEPR